MTMPHKPRAGLRPLCVTGQPDAIVRVYPRVTTLSRRVGPFWRTYPVDPAALASALTNAAALTSGRLPDGTLAVGWQHGQPWYVLRIPAQCWTVQTTEGVLTIPFPPLIWAGWQRAWRVFALDDQEQLMRCPAPNTSDTGWICWGDVAVPTAQATTLLPALRLFMCDSVFNAHLANGASRAAPLNVLRTWRHLHKTQATTYPLDDLLPSTRSLDALIRGALWKEPT